MLAATITVALAQTKTAVSSVTSVPTSSITSVPSSASGTSTSDPAMTLWDIANSLLTSYYPSTSLTQVDTLTWPSAVVIGSSTYTVPPTSVATSGPNDASASQTGAPQSTAPAKGLTNDKKLGIAIGVVVGSLAFAILGVVFFCMHRRKRTTGDFFHRRATPSITDSDIDTWRQPTSWQRASTGPEEAWPNRYNEMPARVPPPMSMHPAYAGAFTRHQSSTETSEDNPFFTPQESARSSPDHYDPEAVMAPYDAPAVIDSPHRAVQRDSRPSTPFSPMMMGANTSAHVRQQQLQQHQHQQPHGAAHDPFASPEDDEADDVVSPIVPTRNSERRYSPMVHYPSWGEVSEFDFSGSGSGSGGNRTVRSTPSNDEDSDGWRPRRESTIGRSELA